MNLIEISKEEAIEFYKTDVHNKLWVMRVMPAGPVDLLPLAWMSQESAIWNDEWFFKNDLTRYFKADSNVVEDKAEELNVMKKRMANLESRSDFKKMDYAEKIGQLTLDI